MTNLNFNDLIKYQHDRKLLNQIAIDYYNNNTFIDINITENDINSIFDLTAINGLITLKKSKHIFRFLNQFQNHLTENTILSSEILQHYITLLKSLKFLFINHIPEIKKGNKDIKNLLIKLKEEK